MAGLALLGAAACVEEHPSFGARSDDESGATATDGPANSNTEAGSHTSTARGSGTLDDSGGEQGSGSDEASSGGPTGTTQAVSATENSTGDPSTSGATGTSSVTTVGTGDTGTSTASTTGTTSGSGSGSSTTDAGSPTDTGGSGTTSTSGTASTTSTSTGGSSTSGTGGGDWTEVIADRDSIVRASKPNFNYGNDVALDIRNSESPSASVAFYIGFSLPAMATDCVEAELVMFNEDEKDPPTNHRVVAKSVADDTWTDLGITYATAPTPGAIVGDVFVETPDVWYAIDVSSDLCTLPGGTSSVSYYVGDESASFGPLVRFTSSNSATTSQHPRLRFR